MLLYIYKAIKPYVIPCYYMLLHLKLLYVIIYNVKIDYFKVLCLMLF